MTATVPARSAVNTVSVHDHGAIGDFAHDDTAAIQAAIDEVSANPYGGIVYFPPGIYLITATLTVRTHNIILQGIGNGYPFNLGGDEQGGSLIWAYAPFSGTYMVEVKLPGAPTVGIQGFRIDGMVLYGGGVDVGGIQADTQQGYFTNTQIVGTGYHALELVNSPGISGTGNYNNVVSQCMIGYSGQYAHGGDVIRVGSTDNKIIDNWFYDWVNNGISVVGDRATHLQLYGNHFNAVTGGAAAGGPAVYADNAAGLEVVGNSFGSCRGGIRIENSATVFWAAFHISDNSFSVPENAVDNNLFDAIYISNVNSVYGGLISDNSFFANAGTNTFRYGVNVVDSRMKNLVIGAMSDQVVQGGAVSAFGTAAIRDNGSVVQTTPRVLAQSAMPVSHTGDLALFALATITVPAHSMGKNGRIRVTAMYGKTGTAGAASLLVYFGGTLSFFGSMAAAHLSNRLQIEIANRGALNSQVAGLTGNDGWGLNTTAWGTAAVNTGADASLVLYGQLANAADTVTLDSYLVELLPG